MTLFPFQKTLCSFVFFYLKEAYTCKHVQHHSKAFVSVKNTKTKWKAYSSVLVTFLKRRKTENCLLSVRLRIVRLKTYIHTYI